MDIDDIRRQNILELEHLAGSASTIAMRLGMSYAQFVNLRDGAKDQRSGKRRGMRKETAWRFEDAFSKPRGWLDMHHAAENLAPYKSHRPLLAQVNKAAAAVNDDGLILVLAIIESIRQSHPFEKKEQRGLDDAMEAAS